MAEKAAEIRKQCLALCTSKHERLAKTQELEEKIVKPYHIENYEETGETWKPSRISDMLTYENITNLDFISNCYNESMRIQPPVYYSSTSAMT